ncbi:3-oxoacyl-ACP reductase FabG [Alkalilimnicola ehrlichii MLHE-1]|uniref:3-oxoacyl-[acyl-carrier-protein] reductase n=1 Tax=Alkalilimnicola ehrlichii (strain ATCC BAA-1101 / DSM 17681 / MLHE-1) TaxID=187272 RepID=Q0A8R7_ALKEH|nr:3-oxoacyl-ACP reductase FabG [Alkalilimnicola ehrlichii]ABI56770.1 3-oxoacyl-[acyl-carrier-protein] reductase [Alkalilimnicola ehrlichii MLHE-1]
MFSNQALENQVALVTGATRGIGRAIALQLGAMGATVVGTATSEKGAERIGETLSAQGIAGGGRVLDVTDPDQVAEVVKAIGADFGAPTVLVNNAGITRDNLMMRMKEEDWSRILDTNLSSAFRMVKACMRGMMKARQGRIINIGSVVASAGNAGQANYCAAKAGLEGLTRSLARELGSRGITVNTVAPGFIETDMTREMPEAQREALVGQIALERLGQPEDIAATVGFLATPAAGYITGSTLHVNGGMYMG